MLTSEAYRKLQDVMEEYGDWVRSSARHVLAMVDVSGRTVVDFGCGRGDWLVVAQELGARAVLGLDTYAMEGAALPVPAEIVDLTQPVRLGARHDIALCLEVGEHIDGAYAETLVQSLVDAAPIVVFSAAVPGQGGVRHVNEQPPGYWHALFRARGYACFDFRHALWENAAIEPWYRMGVLVFAAPGAVTGALAGYAVDAPLHLVHPDIFAAYAPIGEDLILRYDRTERRWFKELLG